MERTMGQEKNKNKTRISRKRMMELNHSRGRHGRSSTELLEQLAFSSFSDFPPARSPLTPRIMEFPWVAPATELPFFVFPELLSLKSSKSFIIPRWTVCHLSFNWVGTWFWSPANINQRGCYFHVWNSVILRGAWDFVNYRQVLHNVDNSYIMLT